jgi:diguanylate cyclase (GGDEF)-like protein/PAS domain S-box-containing protein
MKQVEFTVETLKQLINTSPAAMFIVDKNRNMLFANDSYAKMFGYTLDEVVNVNARQFHIDDESYERFGKVAFEAVSKGMPVETEFHAKKKNGELIWVYVVGSLVKDQDLVLWTMIDITQRKEAKKSLEETNYNLEQYLNAIDNIDIGIFVVDDDYNIRFMNNTMKKWFGNQTNKICYSSVANLDEPCPYCKLEDVIKKNKKVIYEPTTPDGQSFDIVATSIKNSDGTTSKMEVIRNITDKKKAEEKLLKQQEKLIYQAYHDALTGLPNRVLLYDRLEQGIEKSKRSSLKLALLFIDLDHFKEINDSLGHDIGDKVLKSVTKKLHEIVRDEDSLARLGGDEFTVVMQNLKHGQDASILAQKILKIFAEPIIMDSNELYVSCSIGISLYPDDGDSAQNLLKYADSAMYKAKEDGRNNFQFYSSDMTEIAFERIVMEASLRNSLKNGDFIVYFQPQIDAKNKKLIGMEALIRWNHPSMGIVSPAKFIPLAESTGLIIELDRFVMKSAMTQLVKWYEDGLNPGVLALNLSVKQLQHKDFISVFKKMMQDTRCKPQWLELEVTESQIMTNQQKAIEILNDINNLKVNLAIDDFGTGYSSLAYLKKLPINKLKIDQSFIRDLPSDEEDVAITKAVIALAKSLNLDIIAEGVETEKQKEFLIQHGCEKIQGYYYSRPIPSDEMESFLKDDIISKIKD